MNNQRYVLDHYTYTLTTNSRFTWGPEQTEIFRQFIHDHGLKRPDCSSSSRFPIDQLLVNLQLSGYADVLTENGENVQNILEKKVRAKLERTKREMDRSGFGQRNQNDGIHIKWEGEVVNGDGGRDRGVEAIGRGGGLSGSIWASHQLINGSSPNVGRNAGLCGTVNGDRLCGGDMRGRERGQAQVPERNKPITIRDTCSTGPQYILNMYNGPKARGDFTTSTTTSSRSTVTSLGLSDSTDSSLGLISAPSATDDSFCFDETETSSQISDSTVTMSNMERRRHETYESQGNFPSRVQSWASQQHHRVQQAQRDRIHEMEGITDDSGIEVENSTSSNNQSSFSKSTLMSSQPIDSGVGSSRSQSNSIMSMSSSNISWRAHSCAKPVARHVSEVLRSRLAQPNQSKRQVKKAIAAVTERILMEMDEALENFTIVNEDENDDESYLSL